MKFTESKFNRAFTPLDLEVFDGVFASYRQCVEIWSIVTFPQQVAAILAVGQEQSFSGMAREIVVIPALISAEMILTSRLAGP